MAKDDGTKLKRERLETEYESLKNKMERTPLTASILADGGTIRKVDDVPLKQAAQLYKTQIKLHEGTDSEFNTLLGQVCKNDNDIRLQVNKIAKTAVKFAPRTIAATMMESMPDLDKSRGSMNQPDFYERLKPYLWIKDADDGFDLSIYDELVHGVTKFCNRLQDEMKTVSETPITDYRTWVTQFTSGTNSGAYKWESLDKEQWAEVYIPELLSELQEVANGTFTDDMRTWRTPGTYTLFGRTPNRPIHAVAMFEKAAGAKLNYDLTRGIGNSISTTPMAWMSKNAMLERAGHAIAQVECTVHEDFKRFDSFVGPNLCKAVLDGFEQSQFLEHMPQNRNIFRFLATQLTTPTWLKFGLHLDVKMRGSLYSGTPITQVFGSMIHGGFIEMLIEDYGLDIVDYMVLSDDGFCAFNGTAKQGKEYVDKIMIPTADRIGMVLNPKKSYVADVTNRKVMYNGQGVTITRQDAGPFLQQFMQEDPAHAFGNVPRLIRSLKGRERDFERESEQMLFQLLPTMRLSERGDRSQITPWVADFWRILEVMSQLRPGYPRARGFIRDIVKVYPDFWKKFDKLVAAAEASGDVLFDTATKRGGGESERGTTRWLVNYLLKVRSTGVWHLPQDH